MVDEVKLLETEGELTFPVAASDGHAAYDRPLRCLLAELDDVAAWIERTKPQGLLYDSARPAMREAAAVIRSMVRYAALGQAAESNGLVWHNDDGEMRFQPPADLIAEQAIASLGGVQDRSSGSVGTEVK